MSELSRPIARAKIGAGGLTTLVRATAEECAAVAARLDVPAVQSLECLFTLNVEDDGVTVHAQGRLRAEMTRVCVVSAEDFQTPVEEEFEICFVPSGQERDDPDPEQIDEVPYDNDTLDLGEAAIEQLGLVMDPYPRIEGAELPDIGDGGEASPFAALARRAGPGNTRH